MKRKVRAPFLIVNPKAYIYGEESVALAKVCDQLSEEYDLDLSLIHIYGGTQTPE